jgi:hypothetical protein
MLTNRQLQVKRELSSIGLAGLLKIKASLTSSMDPFAITLLTYVSVVGPFAGIHRTDVNNTTCTKRVLLCRVILQDCLAY